MNNQKLFNYILDTFDIILLESEMREIVDIVNEKPLVTRQYLIKRGFVEIQPNVFQIPSIDGFTVYANDGEEICVNFSISDIGSRSFWSPKIEEVEMLIHLYGISVWN